MENQRAQGEDRAEATYQGMYISNAYRAVILLNIWLSTSELSKTIPYLTSACSICVSLYQPSPR